MLYRVTKKYARGSESPVDSYETIAEAKKVIQSKLAQDAIQKVDATYCLYEFFDLLEEFNQAQLGSFDEHPSDSTETEQGGGKGSAQTFRPSPFSTSPQPKGLPRSPWAREDGGNEDDDESSHR